MPDEGGVAAELRIDGDAILALTPWAADVAPHADPALDESEWVRRWRGGWQLCFPTAGQAQPDAVPEQGFHGTASQGSWDVVEKSVDRVTLGWSDRHSLTAHREWSLQPDGLSASTRAHNLGDAPRALILAEHLILGQDVVAPALSGSALQLVVSDSATLAPLQYDGSPAGPPVPWPGDRTEKWDRIDGHTPARVAALVSPGRRIEVCGPRLTATVEWTLLPDLLIWEELARSQEAPWNSSVIALGVEPTSTPHGAGTGTIHGGEVILAPGAAIAWTASLRITSNGSSGPRKERP